MNQFHLIYMRHAISELQYDAIMAEAERYGIDTPKKFLNMIVCSEITRMTDRFKGELSDEELKAYQRHEAGYEHDRDRQVEFRNTDLNEEIPF